MNHHEALQRLLELVPDLRVERDVRFDCWRLIGKRVIVVDSMREFDEDRVQWYARELRGEEPGPWPPALHRVPTS